MRRSTLVAFAAALFWVGLLAAIARNTYGGDIRGFMLVGESFPHPPVFAGAPFSGPIGHDGQFYGALATDPLLLNPETIAVIGNAPAYRAGRVGIPLMAWILALGRGDVAVRLYVLLCWALGLLGVWIAARWLEEEGKSPLWATVVGLSVGLMASLRGALPDAAAASLVVLAIWLNATQRRGALPAIVAACLVRETSVLAAFALGFEELRRRDWRRAATLGGLPILLTAGWRLFVYLRFPTEARAFTASVGFPAGLLSLVPQWRTEPVAIVAVGLTFLAAGVLLRRAR